MNLRVQKLIELNAIWNENTEKENSAFICMTQVNSSETVTTIKANFTITYPVSIALLNFTKDFRRFLTNHRNTIVELLPVSVSETSQKTRDDYTAEDCDGNYGETIVPLTDDLYQAVKRHEGKTKIEILHTSMERILEPLNAVFEARFTVSSRSRKWKCHPVDLLYYHNVSGSKNMSKVKHYQKFFLCVRCLLTWKVVSALKRGKHDSSQTRRRCT